MAKKRYRRTAKEMYYPHFVERMNDRYGIIVTDAVYNNIIKEIQNNHRKTKVRKDNNQRSVHCVYIDGKRVFVVYRKSLGKGPALITALPPSKWLKQQHRRHHLSNSTQTNEAGS